MPVRNRQCHQQASGDGDGANDAPGGFSPRYMPGTMTVCLLVLLCVPMLYRVGPPHQNGRSVNDPFSSPNAGIKAGEVIAARCWRLFGERGRLHSH